MSSFSSLTAVSAGPSPTWWGTSGAPLPGYGYETHTSGAWLDGSTLYLQAQVVGDWLAQIQIFVHLNDSADQVVCRMRAAAEFFAQEYDGLLVGHRSQDSGTAWETAVAKKCEP